MTHEVHHAANIQASFHAHPRDLAAIAAHFSKVIEKKRRASACQSSSAPRAPTICPTLSSPSQAPISPAASDALADCVADVGFHGGGSFVYACPANTFKDDKGVVKEIWKDIKGNEKGKASKGLTAKAAGTLGKGKGKGKGK